MKYKIILATLTYYMFISCSDQHRNYRVVEELAISSLQESNKALTELSYANYHSLSEKLRDDIYGTKVKDSYEKAEKLKLITRNFMTKLEEIVSSDSLQYFKKNYIKETITLDSSLQRNFKSSIDHFLSKSPTEISLAFSIEKTKNDVLILESNFSGYFNNEFGMIIENYTRFSAVVGQNSNHLNSGDTLEISAGIGEFTLAANPKFIINGQTIPPTESMAIYKIAVTGTGRKKIPVIIRYTSQNGKVESLNKMVEYYVHN